MGLLFGGLFLNVVGLAQTLTSSEVEQALDVRLRIALEESRSDLQIVTLRHRSSLEIPDGEIAWELGHGGRFDPSTLGPGRHVLPIVAVVNGALVSRSQVTVTFSQRVETPVLRRSVKRGEQISLADLTMKEINLSRPLSGRVREVSQVVGLVATRGLREGRPLIDKWFQLPLAVDRGDRVRVQLKRGGLKIETTGLALRSGWVGDRISVRNPDSKLRYEVEITAPGEARVPVW